MTIIFNSDLLVSEKVTPRTLKGIAEFNSFQVALPRLGRAIKMLQQFTTNSFELYLRTWPRSSAFRRPERHEKSPATKSFMIDDILKRVEPAKKSKEYSELCK